MKIISIREVPEEPVPLEDGKYVGEWGGSIITIKHDNRNYELTTEGAVRGIGYGVVVTIKDGEATFEEIKNKPFRGR